MKKLMALASLVLVSNVYANTETNTKELEDNQPMMYLSVFDTSGKVAKDTKSRRYSVSQKNLILCWTAYNMPFSPDNKNKVVETFVAPNDKAKFVLPGSTITTKGNTTLVSSTMQSFNNEYMQHCWGLDETDPLGKYSFSLQINDTQFGPTEYEVVK